MANKKLRVAIVCDWLIGGGAERVVLELHRLYPEAPIYTSYCTAEWRQKFDGKVMTGYLQHWPFSRLRKFIPMLRVHWFSHLRLDGYDLVISSSGAEAKAVLTHSQTIHICYCLAPTHYYWSRYEQYMQSPGFGAFNWLARLGLRLLISPMRRWDKRAAQRPDYMIAISSHIQKEIKKYYGRDSVIIHPPVETRRFRAIKDNGKRGGFVAAGRQTAYKRIDLAVAACTQLNVPLTVIGNGPEHVRLVKIAGPTISFQTSTSDNEVVKYFQQAEAFIFPGLDDFGIVAVEAMAAGMPVIAYQDGGALDYVIPGKTGEFFARQTVESLTGILKNFDETAYSESAVQHQASRFDTAHFRQALQDYITKVLKARS